MVREPDVALLMTGSCTQINQVYTGDGASPSVRTYCLDLSQCVHFHWPRLRSASEKLGIALILDVQTETKVSSLNLPLVDIA